MELATLKKKTSLLKKRFEEHSSLQMQLVDSLQNTLERIHILSTTSDSRFLPKGTSKLGVLEQFGEDFFQRLLAMHIENIERIFKALEISLIEEDETISEITTLSKRLEQAATVTLDSTGQRLQCIHSCYRRDHWRKKELLAQLDYQNTMQDFSAFSHFQEKWEDSDIQPFLFDSWLLDDSDDL